ncbi:MAG TPA: histidinol-phosphate transaminase [Casimicrobiaceae bacterium]|nr:histidinol-phosphate transaminase [Casimicrobiaceae bacterium]
MRAPQPSEASLDRPVSSGPATIAPEYVRRIAPYVPGKPIEELAREYGLAEERIVKLASNENPRGPSPRAREAIIAACAGITRYPDGNGFALKSALATHYGVSREQIVLGNGSNDVLELATQAFLRPGDEAVYSQHAFAVYPLATQARGAIGIEVPARNFGHDLDAMARAVTFRTRIVFVANPNNPTGTWLAAPRLREFLAALPRDRLVVLDEAYDEYLGPGERSPSMGWIAEHPNLIVSRTFSKAYGLAGLRVGFGIMDPGVADMLNRVRQPFNVSSVAQAAALAALADAQYVAESAELNRAGFAQLASALDAMGVAYVPSHANFLLVHVGDGARVFEALLRQGVIVRPVANYGLPEHVRVTVGLPEENRRFLAALESALGR